MGLDRIESMGFDWEQNLGAKGAGLADVYDERASDALSQDRPTAAPPGVCSSRTPEQRLAALESSP